MKVTMSGDQAAALLGVLEDQADPALAELKNRLTRIVDAPNVGMKLTVDELQAVIDVVNTTCTSGDAGSPAAIAYWRAMPKLRKMLDLATKPVQARK